MSNSKISALTSATTPLAGTEVLPVVQSSTAKQVSVANLTTGRDIAVASLAATSGVWIGASASVYGESANIVSSNNVWNYYLARNTSSGSSSYAGYALNAYGNSWGFRTGSIAANSNALEIVVDALGAKTIVASATTSGDITYKIGNLIQGTSAKGINFTANTPQAGMTSQLLNWYEEGTFTPSTSTITTISGTPVYTGQYTRIGRQVFISIDMTGGNISVTAGNSFFNLPFTAARTCWGATGNSGYASTGGFCLIGAGSKTLYLATTASYTGFFGANVVYTI